MIEILVALFIKHWVVDFLWQPEYMWKNKGTFGHLGGILHAALHAVITGLILLPVVGSVAYTLMFAEGMLHYYIDFLKVNITRKLNLTYTDPAFWHWLGLDQLLHSLTYIWIFYYVLNSFE